MVTISTSMLWQARTNPNQLAVIYQNQRITYADLADRTLKLADFMHDQ